MNKYKYQIDKTASDSKKLTITHKCSTIQKILDMVRGTICPTYSMRLCNKKIEISPLALFRYGPGTQVVYKYPAYSTLTTESSRQLHSERFFFL